MTGRHVRRSRPAPTHACSSLRPAGDVAAARRTCADTFPYAHTCPIGLPRLSLMAPTRLGGPRRPRDGTPAVRRAWRVSGDARGGFRACRILGDGRGRGPSWAPRSPWGRGLCGGCDRADRGPADRGTCPRRDGRRRTVRGVRGGGQAPRTAGVSQTPQRTHWPRGARRHIAVADLDRSLAADRRRGCRVPMARTRTHGPPHGQDARDEPAPVIHRARVNTQTCSH